MRLKAFIGLLFHIIFLLITWLLRFSISWFVNMNKSEWLLSQITAFMLMNNRLWWNLFDIILHVNLYLNCMKFEKTNFNQWLWWLVWYIYALRIMRCCQRLNRWNMNTNEIPPYNLFCLLLLIKWIHKYRMPYDKNLVWWIHINQIH